MQVAVIKLERIPLRTWKEATWGKAVAGLVAIPEI